MKKSELERWKDKVALITGASAGIGRQIALALGDLGMKVALVARRRDRLDELRDMVVAQGGQALALEADVRNEEQLVAAFDEVRKTWGGVDVLVNSAGLGRIVPLMNPSTQYMREMLEVNVLALCIATREALADMKGKSEGQIIHISSMSGYRVQPGSGMYAATKHAVKALTEGLRKELREANSPVRVSSISPGDTDSEFLSVLYGSKEKAEANHAPYKTMKSDDIAQAALYILSTPPYVEVHDVLIRPTDQPD